MQKTRHIYSVSEVTRDIKLLLENTFNEVWVEGEVSGISRISTGTIFFTLKDKSALLRCVVFASCAGQLKFELKDGLQVVCFGRIGVYEKDGKYQLYLQKAEPKGLGGLQLALEQLKEKLEKEGLFSEARKRPVPYLPAKIGVVTSAEGAAIKDILKVLERRFSDRQIIINPVRVQGEGAKEDIARGINELNLYNRTLPLKERIEVVIVGRGGGSIEDLWAFNEEVVARSIYASKIPVISAVGHERDWTIADLVSDLRAPTPSVAAELVIPRKEDLREKVEGLTGGLKGAFLEIAFGFQEAIDNLAHRVGLNMTHILRLNLDKFNAAAKKLSLLSPEAIIQQYRQRSLDLAKQIHTRASYLLELKEAGFFTAAEKLGALSPLNILSRGYSIVFKEADKKIVKDARQVRSGEALKIKLHRGEILSQAKEIKEDG